MSGADLLGLANIIFQVLCATHDPHSCSCFHPLAAIVTTALPDRFPNWREKKVYVVFTVCTRLQWRTPALHNSMSFCFGSREELENRSVHFRNLAANSLLELCALSFGKGMLLCTSLCFCTIDGTLCFWMYILFWHLDVYLYMLCVQE